MARKGTRRTTAAMIADSLALTNAAVNNVTVLSAWFPTSTQLIIAAGALATARNEISAALVDPPVGDNGE